MSSEQERMQREAAEQAQREEDARVAAEQVKREEVVEQKKYEGGPIPRVSAPSN